MQQSCCHKTNLANYFDDPTPPTCTGSLRCTYVYIATRRQNYCTQEPVLKEQLSAVYITSPELDFSLFATSWGSGLDCNIMKYVLKSRALYAGSL